MADELLNSYLELSLSSERSYLMFLSGLSEAEISGAWAESKTSSDIDKRSGAPGELNAGLFSNMT